MYYILFDNLEIRTKFINYMKENDILTVFHYIPLHSSPAGLKYCKTFGSMENTEKLSNLLVRLPMYYELNDKNLEHIFKIFSNFIKIEKI